MESDALSDAQKAKEALREAWRKNGFYAQGAAKLQEERIEEDIAIGEDAYRICRSVRKYVPFIEAGAMTLAEAITIEAQKPQKSKDEKKS